MTPSPSHELTGGERASLDGVLTRLYEVISFDEGGEPDWDGMKDVFSHHARITRVTPEGVDHLDLPTFCAMAREMVELGAYTGFHEREVSRRVDRLGAVVHVLSAYETKRHPTAVDRLSQGVNSIQLVNEGGEWRVVSLCWDEDGLRGPSVDLRSVIAGEGAVDSPRFRFAPSRIVDSANRFVSEAADAGVIMNRAGRYDGASVEVDGRPMLNFGSCSYLGLEVRDDLKESACEAARRYGTQLPFSRAYLENPLYRELEEQLMTMTERPVLVAPSTTLAHIAALPVLVREGDAVLIDQFAHASLHTATSLLREVPVERVRHNKLDRLEQRIAELSVGGGRVFYVCDGLYSMRGDLAPFARLNALLDAHPALHLYIDDAHATSWSGTRGRGAALEHLGGHPRVIVALSLNKAFSAAGGCLVLPNDDMVRLVRRCGGPMLFSGPIQPPMLGAAVASARLHNDPSFGALQDELAALIAHAWQAVRRRGIPLAGTDQTPIFMLPCDSTGIVFRTVNRLRDLGFYVCPSVFPAVPVNQPGIRFTITRHNDPASIDTFIDALSDALSAAIEEARARGDAGTRAA